MMRLYPTTVFTTLLFTLLCTGVRAQTTIAVMDFDGTTPEMAVATDVLFFDNGADGFFGIHDANGDNTDGTPMDSGDGNAGDIAAITLASIIGDFLFVNDLDDVNEADMEGNGTEGTATVTFGPVSVTGETNVLFSFDYDVVGFESVDQARYELFIDGVGQGEVDLLEGATQPRTFSGRRDIIVPDGSGSVTLELRIMQNGDSDQAAFDNFEVTSDNTGLPCGVTSFGPTATETCSAFTNGGAPDLYTLSFDYGGVDAGGTLALLVNGTAASSFTNNGADPTVTDGGTIDISSPDLVEGTSYEVTFTNPELTCDYSVSGSVAIDACVAVCDLSTDPTTDVKIICDGFTSADNADMVRIEIDYDGAEAGVVVSAPGLTIGGDDPAVDEDGTILLTGAVEGGSYTVTISGGDCMGADAFTIPITVAPNFCTPSDLIINEVLADPGTVNDANNDGVFSGSDDEFIELYNIGTTDIDVSGWTISEGAGVRYTFPEGSVIPAMTGFVLFGGGTPDVPCTNSVADTPFIGLNNSGDVVIVSDDAGLTVAQMSYGAEGNSDQSVALNPNGDLSGGYVQHTTIANPDGAPLTHSACFENDSPAVGLPVELLSLSAETMSKSVAVSWATASEDDNDYFSVERSLNGHQWTVIGKVTAGNATENEYVFYDEAPLNGDNLYRLRQIDFDGTSTVYGPVMATFSTGELLVFPNPAGPVLRFGGDITSADVLTLLSADGQVIRQVAAGTDRVGIEDLKAGIYLLRVERGDGVDILRFVKK